MKPLILSLALILVAQMNYAQAELAYQITSRDASLATKTVHTTSTAIVKQHSHLAMQALRSHLQRNLEYPELMQQYLIEGEGVIEVAIMKSGKVEEVRILKSISPLFDKAILTALESLETVFTQEQKYLGSRYLQLPVAFSIE